MTLIRDMRERISHLADLLAKSEAMNKRIRRERDAELTADPLYRRAVEVLEYWSEKLEPGARELRGGERIRCVLARLHGKPKPYMVDDLKRCVDGYVAFPFVVDGRRRTDGPAAMRQVKATLIFRDPEHVDAGLRFADIAEQRAKPVPVARPAVTQLSDLGQRAVRYAEYGWYVFPILPRSKVPGCKNGLSDATRDLDRIVKFWASYPDYNIGILCGMESEIVILDMDAHKDGIAALRALERQHSDLPRTASVATPRGGTHFYFRHPSVKVQPIANYPAAGLDIRGDGSYVLAPGSIGPTGKPYEVDEQAPIADMPDWLLKLLMERQRHVGVAADPAEWEAIFREGVREGSRNDQLTRLAGHLWSKGLAPGEVQQILFLTNQQRFRPPLPDREVIKIVQSIAKMRARDAASRTAP